MNCLRQIRLVLCIAFACAFLARADEPRPERLIAYVDEDSPGVRRVLDKIQSAMERMGTTKRHNVRFVLVPATLSDKILLEKVLRQALARRPAAILASNSNVAMVAKALTTEVPIVFGSHQDPIAVGLADSLARPGGNVTGFTYFVPVDQKRLELLRELAPRARKLGIVTDRWWLDESGGRLAVRMAAALGFDVALFPAESEVELQTALASRRARAMDAWYVPYTRLAYEKPDVMVNDLRAMRRPTLYTTTRAVEDGGLMSYQQLLTLEETISLLATMLTLVLDGVPAGQIPIERPKAFELAINSNTARQLGLKIPQAMLKRADRVITGTGVDVR